MAKVPKSAPSTTAHKQHQRKATLPPQPRRSALWRGFALSASALVLLLVSWKLFFSSAPKDTNQGLSRKPAFPPSRAVAHTPEPVFEDFVGAEVCADCHSKQYNLWKNSTHGRAGGAPRAQTVISPFNGTPLRFKDATVTPSVQGSTYEFRVQQKDFAERRFEVKAVIGGGHLQGGGTQSYFAEFPDGTLRFLPFDFIRKEATWFGETKDRRGWLPVNGDLALTELSEWPPSRVLGAADNLLNCQECHGSQIETKYDVQQKRYQTRYQTLAINCESCHGPGKRHVALAQSGALTSAADIGMPALATFAKDQALQVCFQCHALKDVLTPGYLPGKNLFAYYALKFPMLGENPYHADGRIRAFGYQENHLFSACYRNGAMTCVDCHDPHAQTYRDAHGAPLPGRFANAQCTSCHPSKAVRLLQHTHHRADSPGSACVACHMPYLQHQAMGKRLRFARSDHTIAIPRPEFDAAEGIESACAQCHKDRSNAWLQKQTQAWYGEIKPHPALVQGLMQARNVHDRKAAANLLLHENEAHVIAQVAALCYFLENFLQPNLPSLETEIVAKLQQLGMQDDLDLRALALASLHLAQGEQPAVREFLLARLQQDEQEALVRARWVLALTQLAGSYRESGALETARITYEKALELEPQAATIHFNLGLTYNQQGDFTRAIAAYQHALAANPNDPLVLVNLGIAQRRLGQPALAIAAYQQALALNPQHTLAHFNLGNVYYEQGQMADAIASYDKARELDPSLAAAHFFLARAYLKTKQAEPAVRALRAGLHYAPEDAEARKLLQDLETYLSQAH